MASLVFSTLSPADLAMPSTPRGGWSHGSPSSSSTPSEIYHSDNSTPGESYLKAEFEEGAREMRKLKEPELRNMVHWDMQAQIDLLQRRISHEEVHSRGSPLHIKLLQDYDEAVSTKNMRDMQRSTAKCMETIARLEKDNKYYKARLAEEFELNRKLHGALIRIQDNTETECLAALSGRSAPTAQAWGSST